MNLFFVWPGRNTPRDNLPVEGLQKARKLMGDIYLADTTTTDSMRVNAYIDKHIRSNGDLPFRPDRLKLLLSFHYFKKVDLRELLAKYFGSIYPMIFVDSGGFSATTQGLEIDINSYMDWLKKFNDIITVYANLDEIGNPELTYERQKIMEASGLNPLPVFHTGEPVSWLERYIDEGYDYICLGGMVPYSKDRKRLVKWMSLCFDIAEKSGKEIKYHGFGMTNWDLMRAYPWESVDSSSWCSGFRYGSVPIFDSRTGTFTTIQLKDLKKSYKYARVLREYGFSPNDLAMDKEFDRVKIATISAMSYLKAEEWLKQRRRSLQGKNVSSNSKEQRSSGCVDNESISEDPNLKPRGLLQQSKTLSSANKHDGVSERGRGRLGDDRRSSDSRETGIYLVSLPPMEKGSEHNPNSKWVGGTQMFTSFKSIVGDTNEQ